VNAVAVIREGEGPEVLLVHGGASPRTTWGALSALSSRWTLEFVHRRGYPPSPRPVEGRQDFDVDANDLIPLLDRRPHVVAHSYGVLGTLIAATRRPECALTDADRAADLFPNRARSGGGTPGSHGERRADARSRH
jgi:pimeloyl-ACP methyl ester carboxylesterase